MNSPVHELAALISAAGVLLAGLGAILPALKRHQDKQTQESPREHASRGLLPYVAITAGVAVIAFAVGLVVGSVYLEEKVPANVSATTAAWDALNRGDFAHALTLAKDCESTFREAAHAMQTKLMVQNAPEPPVGKVTGKALQNVLDRGPLNDVAACLYIHGQAAEALEQPSVFKKSYIEAMTYSYARVWDRQGILWSPKEAAAARLGERSN